jgi:FMN phosphatase YigB (HAD superfamily)
VITTLLFDLDDTLVGNDLGVFLPAFFQAVAEHFAAEPHAGRLVAEMIAGTRAILANTDPSRTLFEIFSDCFSAALDWPTEVWAPAFDHFYATRYEALAPLVAPRPAARAFLDWAFGAGYEVAVTTNPLFTAPAIAGRLRWAGLSHYPFALVTNMATSHFAKPRPEFYAEVLARLGRRPEQALVVGDDWHNDILPAAALGLAAYWITPAGAEVQPPAEGPALLGSSLDWVDAHPVGQGTLDDFAAWAPSHLSRRSEAAPPTGPALPYRLAGNLAALDGDLRGLPASAWAARAAPGEWSITEVLCHLRDVEREVNLPRQRTVVEQHNPFISGADTDPWAIERDYHAQSGPAALAEFAAARKEAVRFLRAQPNETWQRTARHAIFGPTLLAEIVSWVLDHDGIHLDQIRQTKKRLAS